jgi:hypothetical protein
VLKLKSADESPQASGRRPRIPHPNRTMSSGPPPYACRPAP